MALNYTRVGWEDAPSRNTPVDAANLNHMDNGILALSTAYDEDVPRLQEQVDELASNIATNTIKEVLGNFAEVEDTPVATKNYAIGDYLVLNKHFYKATAAITSGNTLVEGTNIERTNVGAEVENIEENIEEHESTIALTGAVVGNATIVRCRKMCIFTFDNSCHISSITANTVYDIGVIPVGYRPHNLLRVQPLVTNGYMNQSITYPLQIVMNADGKIQCWGGVNVPSQSIGVYCAAAWKTA